MPAIEPLGVSLAEARPSIVPVYGHVTEQIAQGGFSYKTDILTPTLVVAKYRETADAAAAAASFWAGQRQTRRQA